MSKPERLHPAAIVFNIIRGVRDLIFLFVLAFVTLMDNHIMYSILAVLALLILVTFTSILAWSRFTYRIEGDELRLEYGIFIRKKRYISKNRIQSIDLTQNIIHRIFKLVKVEIETAGTGAEAEASLAAVTLEKGEALREELKSIVKVENAEEEASPRYPTKTISRKRLLIAGATSGSVGVLAAAFGVIFSEMERFIPTTFYDEAYRWIIGLSIVFIVFMAVGVLIFLWLLGIIGTMLKYWNFTITKIGEDIVITRGLLEKKQITIPLKRIQAVGYVESVIRQPLQYATIIAEIAGGSNEQGEEFSTVLFPIMKKSEVESFLNEFLPDYIMDQSSMFRVPKRSLKYYLARLVIPALIILVAVLFIIPSFTWIPFALLIISIVLGVLQYKDSGYVIEGKKITICYRVIGKVTMVLSQNRIQALNKKQNPFHRKEDLATIQLSIIGKMGQGKHYRIKELELESVNNLADWYSNRGD